MDSYEASSTYPIDHNELKVGGYVVIKNRPCKIMSVDTVKNGKHGAAKSTVVGIDIFTHKKYVTTFSGSCVIEAPRVKREQLQFIGFDSDEATVLDSNNNVINIKLLSTYECDKDAYNNTDAEYEATILSAMNETYVTEVK